MLNLHIKRDKHHYNYVIKSVCLFWLPRLDYDSLRSHVCLDYPITHRKARVLGVSPISPVRLLPKKKAQYGVPSVHRIVLGSPGWTRTNDNAINSRGLYRL